MRSAIVTGGSRGIGKAIATTLAGNGIRVALTYRTSKKKATSVVKEIEKAGGQAMCIQLNQKDRKAIRRIIKAVRKELGGINILVNNAAIVQKKEFFDISNSDFDNMMSVNLRGPFILCQELMPEMIKKKWGRIVNISSIAGQTGGVNQVHYAVAKAGLINLTRSLARLYSKYGVTINAIAPEWIRTKQMEDDLGYDFDTIDFSHIPIGRVGETEEVAGAVSFLCSDNASYITGQTINVNGGIYFG
jgi:acetoacetyl-CoA reductase/3-oxoacyl-[acyl-carrier protein] reductase